MIDAPRPRRYGPFVQYPHGRARAIIPDTRAHDRARAFRGRRTIMKVYRTDGGGSLWPVLTIVALALAAGSGGGCASEGEKMVDSFTQTRKTVAEAQRQVD